MTGSAPLAIVTGARGYIGAHAVKALCDCGYEVIATDLDRKPGNDISAYASEFFAWDIRQPPPPQALAHRTAAVVIHLAALVSVEESVDRPTDYYQTNLLGTLNVIESFPKSKIIFASTGAAFGMDSPYAISKASAEHVVREKCATYTILRFFNVAGSGGFRHFGAATHLIRRAAMAARGEIPSLSIYGTDYDTRDGTCVRDYVHVEDIADAICMAAKEPAMMSKYECLGTGTGHTVREVIAAMQIVADREFEVHTEERRKGDAPVSAVPSVSTLMRCSRTLEDMCRSALEVTESTADEPRAQKG